MNDQKKIAVVGVGNTLRSDDGVGMFICTELEKANIQGLSIITTHQLHVELVEDLKTFGTIIIVDAGINPNNEVSFYPITEQDCTSIHSSHNIDATLLFSLLQNLYPSDRRFFVCEIQVQNFELGENLSSMALINAGKAVNLITEFIKKRD